QRDVLSDPSDRLRYLSATLTVIWQDRLTMRSARPLARGMMRLSERPSLTKTVLTFRSSTSAPSLCSALATADSSTFFMISAAFLLLKASRLSASPTFFPRIWSATRRAFWAEMRAPDNLAATSISKPLNACLSCRQRDHDRYACRRIRPVCGRPCLRSRGPVHVDDRYAQRWSDRPSAAGSWSDATRFSLACDRSFPPP